MLLILLLLVLCCLPARGAEQGPAQLFEAHCATCHDRPETKAPTREVLRQMPLSRILVSLELGKMAVQGAALTAGQREQVGVWLARGNNEANAWIERNRCAATFHIDNAETWGDDDCADVVTVMFALPEAPREGRRAILANALRLAKRNVLVVDIAPHYTPSPAMLSGEPYVIDYLKCIDDDIRSFDPHVETEIRAKTVKVWILQSKSRQMDSSRLVDDGS